MASQVRNGEINMTWLWVLLAFIAGGALMGVVSAVLKYCGADWFIHWSGAEVLAVVMYVLIILYFIYDALRAKQAE